MFFRVYQVTATLSCGSVNCVVKQEQAGEITEAGIAWDPVALT